MGDERASASSVLHFPSMLPRHDSSRRGRSTRGPGRTRPGTWLGPSAPQQIETPNVTVWVCPNCFSVWGKVGSREEAEKLVAKLYWDWAAQFTLCANYFTDVASQSEPNHLFMIAAESPIIDNAHPSRTYQPQPPYAMPGSLPEALAIAGRTWRSYGAPYFRNIAALAGSPNNESDPAKFDVDAGANTLAEVSWLYAPEGSSEHPGNRPVHGVPAGPAIGPGVTWTADRIKAILDGGAWSSTAIFLTWDDWGGWYDHVAAPENRVWQGGDPSGPGRKATYAGTQFRFGPRVPCLVITPYAKQGVNTSFCSHASLVKFCIRLFGLQPWDVPALAADDPSGDMWDCFDFGTARADKPAVSQVPGAN